MTFDTFVAFAAMGLAIVLQTVAILFLSRSVRAVSSLWVTHVANRERHLQGLAEQYGAVGDDPL